MRTLLIISLTVLLGHFSSAQDSLYQVAQSMYSMKDYDGAYKHFREAGLAYQLRDQFGKYAECNLNMARCLMAAGNLRQAVSLADNTTGYITDVFSEEKKLLYDALMLTSEGHLKSGRNDLALEALQSAEANLTSTSGLDAARCYSSLGIVYWNTGNKATALDYLERSLTIRKAILPENHEMLADSYLNIGLIYLDEEYLQAIIYFERALNIYQSNFGSKHAKVALCYSNIAHAHRKLGNFNEALAYLDYTMDIWDSTYPGDHPNKAFVKSSKGNIYEEQGDLNKALLMYQEVLQEYLRLYGTRHPEIANTYYLIGSALNKQQKYRDAVEHFQQAIYANLFDQTYESIYDLPDLQNYFNADILLFSLQSKAQALEALHFGKSLNIKDIEGAFETYKTCDRLIAKIRQGRLDERDKIKIANVAFDVYDNGIRIALYLSNRTFRKPYFTREAFRFSERSKSAVLLDAINETKAKHFAGIPDELIQLEDSLKKEIGWLEQQLSQSAEISNQLKSRLFTYQQSYRNYISDLEEKYPSYYQLKYNEQTVSITDIQSHLRPHQALLSYFVGNETIYVFYVTNNDLQAYELPKTKDLPQIINAFRNGMKYQVEAAINSSAHKLYKQLIPPLDSHIRSLVIVPDGILGTIPFEAFNIHDPEKNELPSYLISKYAISYAYATSLFLDSSKSKDRETAGILLTAPVTFQGNEVPMPTLADTEKEVNKIRYLFLSSGDKPTVYLNSRASEAIIKSPTLADYRFLHLATHGMVNQSKPNLSRIFLSPGEQEDGSLYAGEIYNLKINANLVTLSACETGLGKLEKGEGIIGLSRALTYAGASNLMVSLWQVSDASTAQLMIEFYKQHLYHEGNDLFSNDLRQAKLSLIHDQKYSSPYYWAPFILIGN